MKNIWKIKDKNKFIIALLEHLEEKTDYGDDLSGLSRPERIFYVVQMVEMEVNNGGFSQFFSNSSGDFSNEIVDAFTEIGADATAGICRKAIGVFGREIPADQDERDEMLEELESDEIDEILEECDSAFYEYEDNLNELNYNYVMKNKQYFQHPRTT